MIFRGYEVLEEEPVPADEWSESYSSADYSLEAPTGAFRNALVGTYPLIDRPYSLMMEGRPRIQLFRSWLGGKYGRVIPFWVPTWRRDFALANSYVPLSTQLTIRDMG